jgi:phosphoglucosamine mutase
LALRFAERLGRPARFIVGRDTRESGPWIEAAISGGVQTGGSGIESAGIITTPGVAFLTPSFEFDAGIVISASHNSFEDNGIKVFLPDGRKLDEKTEREIEQDISTTSDEIDGLETGPDTGRSDQFCSAYIEHLGGKFPELKLNDLHIVIDCANGAASHLAPVIFEKLGAKPQVINASPDGRNINKDCGSLHLEHLQKAVIKSGADIGVAYDGDADRALFVDEKGNIVDGDATLWILAQRFLDEGRLAHSKVVATVMSNIGLEIALRSKGIELDRTAVGDKYVLDELLRSGAAIGGEQSGHIIFPHESLVGDGMMTTLFLLDTLVSKKQRLSDAAAGFDRYPQILVNVPVREKKPFESVPGIAAAVAELDGKLDGNGRLLLRYSGTENLARVMIEGRDQSEIEQQAHELAEAIKTELG